jgi:hypothetical protein
MGLARETAGWILGRGVWKFSRRECHRAFDHRIETVAELAPILELRVEYGYIRPAESDATGPGRRSRTTSTPHN